MNENYIVNKLFEMQDLKYRDFCARLVPTVPKDLIIGVRTPDLRRLAKEIKNTDYAAEFLDALPHKYCEENNLHAFLIEGIDDFDECIAEINRFLPYVDNWATCDSMRPKILKKHLPELIEYIKIWISSGEAYTVRFGIEMLMCYYLDGNFSPEFPEIISKIRSDEYYVRMMVAWYFATALAKRYEDVVLYIEQNRLDADTHNKTIQKAVESYRITAEQKKYLKTLKR